MIELPALRSCKSSVDFTGAISVLEAGLNAASDRLRKLEEQQVDPTIDAKIYYYTHGHDPEWSPFASIAK